MGRLGDNGLTKTCYQRATVREKINPVTAHTRGHRRVARDRSALVVVISVSVHRFSQLVPIQRQNECRTRWFKLIQSVSAWKGVTRSRRSSAWPIPFCGQLLTSQSGTVDGPGGESSPRGTEAVCLCSGRAGRSHTVGRKEEGQKKRRWRRKGKTGKRRDELTNCILYFTCTFSYI